MPTNTAINRTNNPIVHNFSGTATSSSSAYTGKSTMSEIINNSQTNFNNIFLRVTGDTTIISPVSKGIYQDVVDLYKNGGSLPDGWTITYQGQTVSWDSGMSDFAFTGDPEDLITDSTHRLVTSSEKNTYTAITPTRLHFTFDSSTGAISGFTQTWTRTTGEQASLRLAEFVGEILKEASSTKNNPLRNLKNNGSSDNPSDKYLMENDYYVFLNMTAEVGEAQSLGYAGRIYLPLRPEEEKNIVQDYVPMVYLSPSQAEGSVATKYCETKRNVLGESGRRAYVEFTLLNSSPVTVPCLQLIRCKSTMASVDCLSFEAVSANTVIQMGVVGTPTLSQNFQYSSDRISWYTFTPGTTAINLPNIGDVIYFRGNNTSGINESSSVYYYFNITQGNASAYGTVMSLIDNGQGAETAIPNNYCFNRLFYNCTRLVGAPELTASTVTQGCYESMFEGCTGLITVPALPAPGLQTDCYKNMFKGCTSLYVADVLDSATTDTTWKIPETQVCSVSSTLTMTDMFTNCLGSRTTVTDSPSFVNGQQVTLYTRNAVLSRPTSEQLNPTSVYNGQLQTNGFSIVGLEFVRGEVSGTDVGQYISYYRPDSLHIWTDTKDKSEVAVTFTITQKSISGATITLTSNNFVYNQADYEQTIESVVIDDLTATYTATGTVAQTAGSHTITCTGTGNFTGTETATWNIAQRQISDSSVHITTTLGPSLTYNATEQTQTISNITISVDDGGTIEYASGSPFVLTDNIQTNVSSTGYTMTITCPNNFGFTGSFTQAWNILPKNITGATITLGTALTYNGQTQTQTVSSVIIEGLTVPSAMYTVSGNEQIIVSSTYYTLACTGSGNFTGTETKEWNIAPLSISGATVTLGPALTYSGEEQTQTVSSVVINSLAATFTVSDNMQTDVGSEDYTLTCTGYGNFTGTQTKNWNISPRDISGATITLGTSPTYNGEQQTQSVVSVVVNSETIPTTGYTVTGNTATNVSDSSYTLTCTASGGNFTGSATKLWNIIPLSIASGTIVLGAANTYDGTEKTQTVSSITVNGLSAAFTVTDNVQTHVSSTGYILTCTGTGNFGGTQTCNWNIDPLTISGSTITLSGGTITYNGNPQTQGVASVVTSGGLTATYSVSGNTGTNAGSYTLTCTGTGDFGGNETKSWSIAKASGYVNLSTSSLSVGTRKTGSFNINSTHGGTTSCSYSGQCSAAISGTTVTVTGSTSTGSGTVTISCAATTNYNAASASVSVTVSQSTASCTVHGQTYLSGSGSYAEYDAYFAGYNYLSTWGDLLPSRGDAFSSTSQVWDGLNSAWHYFRHQEYVNEPFGEGTQYEADDTYPRHRLDGIYYSGKFYYNGTAVKFTDSIIDGGYYTTDTRYPY